jgi:hypothetical protein
MVETETVETETVETEMVEMEMVEMEMVEMEMVEMEMVEMETHNLLLKLPAALQASILARDLLPKMRSLKRSLVLEITFFRLEKLRNALTRWSWMFISMRFSVSQT